MRWLIITTIWKRDNSYWQKKETSFIKKYIPLNCMIQEKATLPKITSLYIMEVWKVIDKFTNDTPPFVTGDYVNYEHEGRIRKDLVNRNDTKENNKLREISIQTENKDVIHRYITDNETEKIWIPIKR